MRWFSPRSLRTALAVLPLTVAFLGRVAPRADGQASPPGASPTSASAVDLDKQLEELDQAINQQLDAGKVAEAIPPARQMLELLERTRVKDHWQTGDARRSLETYRQLAAQPRAVQDRYARARQAEAQARGLYERSQLAAALPLFQEVLSIHRDILGEDHPQTAAAFNNLGLTLHNQGKLAEAEAKYGRAREIALKVLGEDHPATADAYNNLAGILQDQGKLAEAEPLHRRALAITIRALGEESPETAISYNNLAEAIRDQGRYPEAEAMHRHALAIWLEAKGEDDPGTADSYSNLAETLKVQGRSAEAEAMHRRALAIRLAVLDKDHSDIAVSSSNLADLLQAEGRFVDAEEMHRRALAIDVQALGEESPETAASYHNLAECLAAQGKHAEAEAKHRHALATRRRALGEDHPFTAVSYNNLAATLRDQGKSAEAEPMLRRALAITIRALGPDHPRTVAASKNLAWLLEFQGKHDEALQTFGSAAASYERARLRGTKGLEAALGADKSPLPALALALVRAGQPREAWTRWEQGLARGILDEVTGRATRPLTSQERDQEARLLGQAQAIDERIGKLLALEALTTDQETLLEDLRRQGSEFRRQLLELEHQFESRYDAPVGRPAPLEAVQQALPEGTALLGWLDVELPGVDGFSDHWACLLRRTGAPLWVRLPGSSKDLRWSVDERALVHRLRGELTRETIHGNARPLAQAVARQRLEPLKAHLQGIHRLVVVNSPGLAGVPVEVLLAARPDPAWERIAVAYAPSASLFAYVVAKSTLRDRAATLLALADPAYPQPRPDAALPSPPDTGLAISRIVPNRMADLKGFRKGDVLLTYAGTPLARAEDLESAAPAAGPKQVLVRFWREGITREVKVAAGPLGVVIDPRPARVAVQAAREAKERVVLGMRGRSRQRLPGTRREVEAIARLFPAEGVTTLMGSRACESAVQELARTGRMKDFRFLHFAAHGESDPRHAYRSALILAPDPDRANDPQAFDTDGTITAEQIARTWQLDADLVVLSGCETGLGRSAGSEGYLGFAQPLFAKGARSLVLSLWKVDDTATALLMTRFYQNLLGRRAGRTAPMAKAEALAEAKAWLRIVGSEEVGEALAALPRGPIVRREVIAARPAPPPNTQPGSGDGNPRPPRDGGPNRSSRPYENAVSWAGFILVGSPD